MTTVVNGETGAKIDGAKLQKLFDAMSRLDEKKAAISADVRSIKDEAELLGLSRSGFMRNYRKSQMSPEERARDDMEDAVIQRSLGWDDLAAEGRLEASGQATLLPAEKKAAKPNGKGNGKANGKGHAKAAAKPQRRDKQEGKRKAALKAAAEMPENVTKLHS